MDESNHANLLRMGAPAERTRLLLSFIPPGYRRGVPDPSRGGVAAVAQGVEVLTHGHGGVPALYLQITWPSREQARERGHMCACVCRQHRDPTTRHAELCWKPHKDTIRAEAARAQAAGAE